MDDRVDLLQGHSPGVGVADVATNELERRVAPGRQNRGDSAVHQGVQNPNTMAAAQQLLDQQGADVAGSTGDEYVPLHPRLSPSVVRNPNSSIVVSVSGGRYSTCG